MSLQIKTWVQPWNESIQFLLVQKFQDGRAAFAQPIQMVIPDPGADAVMRSPTFELTRERAQELMDRLWMCGLRPTEGTGSAGSLAATQKHLEDMRAIALHKLGMDQPKGTR